MCHWFSSPPQSSTYPVSSLSRSRNQLGMASRLQGCTRHYRSSLWFCQCRSTWWIWTDLYNLVLQYQVISGFSWHRECLLMESSNSFLVFLPAHLLPSWSTFYQSQLDQYLQSLFGFFCRLLSKSLPSICTIFRLQILYLELPMTWALPSGWYHTGLSCPRSIFESSCRSIFCSSVRRNC